MNSFDLQGEVHPKMITSYLVVFEALNGDDVLVVEQESFFCVGLGHAKEATAKMSSLSGTGAAQLFNRLYTQKRLIACTSDLDHSTQRPEHYDI